MTDTQLILGISIALVIEIITPITLLYHKGPWQFRTTIVSLLGIVILFCLIYTPIHELSHVAGLYLSGGWASAIHLYPKIFAGHIITARYIPRDINYPWQFLVMTSFPYIVNVITAIIGILFLRSDLKKPFVVGFLFMLLCLRPIFDFTGETLGFLAKNGGDFCQIAMILGNSTTWTILLLIFGLAIISAIVVFHKYSGLPHPKFLKTTRMS